MNFTEIAKNPRFVNLTALIRVPFWSSRWRGEHQDVPFWTLWKTLDTMTPTEPPLNREQALAALLNLLNSVSTSDERLQYRQEDVGWIAETFDKSDSELLVVLNLFKAYASSPDVMYTPGEIADATGTAESGWRNKAAAGQIPGSIKKGKQWLLPRSVLLSASAITEEQVKDLDAAYRVAEEMGSGDEPPV